MIAPRPIVPIRPLSEASLRVWTALQGAGAISREYAMVDRDIAIAADVHERDIIECVDELNERGMFVVAKSAHGRWIGTVQEAIAYCEDLRRRVRNQFAKVRAIKRGIALRQKQEQLSLFNQPGVLS